MKILFTTRRLQLFAALISVALSLIALQTHDPINYDGILYLRVSTAFLSGGISAAMHVYPWPFYSIFVATCSKLTGLSLLHTTSLISIILAIIIVVTFIALIKQLGGDIATQIAAAIIILIYPEIDHSRALIFRDFGYWAFYLLGLLQLLRFSQHYRFRQAFGFGLSLLLATLFRIEGAIFWLLAPCALLFNTDFSIGKRLLMIAKVQILLLIAFVTLFCVMLYHANITQYFGRLTELFNQISHGLSLAFTTFETKKTAMTQYILSYDARDSAETILVGGLISLLIVNIIETLSPLYTLFCLHSITQKLLPANRETKAILTTFIILNLLILCIFLGQQLFLTDRYVAGLCLVLLLWTPFSLQRCYFNWRHKLPGLTGKTYTFVAICLVMLSMCISDVIRFGHSKRYITDAGIWIASNTPEKAKLYTNSKEIAFYANRAGIDWENDFDDAHPFKKIYAKEKLQGYNYIALRIRSEQQQEKNQLIKIIGKPPIKIFSTPQGDAIIIFQINEAQIRE